MRALRVPDLRCVTGGSPRLLGYAATCRVRSADPPMTGNAYVDRTDWWEAIGLLPVPAHRRDPGSGRGR